MYTDPIADMLTRIRNALAARHSELVMPYSKMKENLASLMVSEGFLSGVKVKETGVKKTLVISLKYVDSHPVIVNLKRISTPGQRMYAKVDKIPRTNGGFGLTVISTSKGLISDRQARKERTGGELICQIW
jgi:small subunit ribosomal protein S8